MSDNSNRPPEIIQAARCPNCGANLHLSEPHGFVKCSFCGSNIIININAAVKNEGAPLDAAGIPATAEQRKTGGGKIFPRALALGIVVFALWFYVAASPVKTPHSVSFAPVSPDNKGTIRTVQYSVSDSSYSSHGNPATRNMQENYSGPPVITSVLPSCDFKEVRVTIRGKGFGNRSDGNVIFYGRQANDILEWSNSRIVFKIPYGPDSEDIFVRSGSKTSDGYKITIPYFKFVKKWGSFGSFDGQMKFSCGAAVNSKKNLLIADRRNNRIQVFSNSGDFLFKFGNSGSGPGDFNDPFKVIIDEEDNIYVTDSINCRVEIFDPNGKFLRQFGSKGLNDGQFDVPASIALDSKGFLYVSDFNNHRIQKFDKTGKFVAKWGSYGNGNDQLGAVHSIAAGPGNLIYVLDSGNYCLKIFEETGKFMQKIGRQGSENDEFTILSSVTLDSSGNIYLTDSGDDAIKVFDKTGKFVIKIKNPGDGDMQFKGPSELAFDSNSNMFVMDYLNHRIQKFSLSR